MKWAAASKPSPASAPTARARRSAGHARRVQAARTLTGLARNLARAADRVAARPVPCYIQAPEAKFNGEASMPAFVGLLIFALSLVGLGQTASAAIIVGQAPCSSVSLGGACLKIDAGSPIPVIRPIAFNAPHAGTAAVTFQGSLVCTNSSATDKVVDFATQIVTNAARVPAVNGPGGMRLAKVLKDSSNHTLRTTDGFNLASTRVVNIPAAGTKHFFFKIAALRMDANTNCLVYNAAFTVQFAP
jgi:hypothetical protein